MSSFLRRIPALLLEELCTQAMELQDTYRHQGMRRRMVEDLREKDMGSPAVLDAMMKVPRHQFFFDAAFLEKAYDDRAFRIMAGQTISHPSTVAFQTSLLQVTKGTKVLEIGTGSGYQTAVLLQLGCQVYTIERQHELFIKTRHLFAAMKLKAQTFFGDGYQGLTTFAPFDRVLVTCGAPFVPEALVEQLVPGGRMVIPVGEGSTQVMWVIDKAADGTLRREAHGEFRFVPMLGEEEKGWK